MRLLTHALVLVPLVGLVACGSGAQAAGSAAGREATVGGGAETLAQLDTIRSAVEQEHLGVRRVELYDEDGLETLTYRERVATDGEGRFSLRPIEALTPVPADWSLRQITGEGFLFRYRDFSIRDREGFLRNYSLVGPEPGGEVAGRATERFVAEGRGERGAVWELWLDRETGVPLRVEERGPGGRLRSRLEYESFETSYDASGVVWFQGTHGERELNPRASIAEQVGRPVPLPRLLPPGFRLASASSLEDEDGAWVKLTYSDGVEAFFFLHQAPVIPPTAVEHPVSQLEQGSGGDLYLHRIGAAGVAQAVLPEGTFIAVGRVDDPLLVDTIESALP